MVADNSASEHTDAQLRRVRYWGRMRIVAVWVAAVALVVAVGLFASPQRQLTWVSISMMMLVLLTGLLQLADGRSAGYIHRFTLSLVGAALVLAIGTLIFLANGAQSWVLV